MPKQTYTISQFHGGLNTADYPTDVKPNELTNAKNVTVDTAGRIKLLGGTVVHTANTSSPSVTIPAGRGLITFNHPKSGGTSGTGTVGTDIVTHYIAKINTADASVRLWGDQPSAAWGTVADLGPSTLNLPCMYYVGGALRISDGNYESSRLTNVGTLDGAIAASGSAGTEYEISEFDQNTFDLNASHGLTSGAIVEIDGEVIQLTTISTNTVTNAIRGLWGTKRVPHADNAVVSTFNSSKWYGYVQNEYTGGHATSKWFLDEQQVAEPVVKSSAYGGTNQITYEFINNTATESDTYEDNLNSGEIGITIHAYETLDTITGGNWLSDGNGRFSIYFSYVYDGKQETVLNKAATFIDYPDRVLKIKCAVLLGSGLVNPRINGWRLWGQDEGATNLNLIAEWDLGKGMKWGDEDDWRAWEHRTPTAGSIVMRTNGGVRQEKINRTTFQDLHFYNWDEVRQTNYGCSVLANDMIYVGNVKKEGKVYPDIMIKSPPGEYDTFPLSRKIASSLSDGHEIVQLETYADRLLQFKKDRMVLINISQEIEFTEDIFKYKGVSHPAAVCSTEYGVAWVNENGVFLYDGENVRSLFHKRSQRVIGEKWWADFLTSAKDGTGSALTPMIGYVPKTRKLLIFDDISTTSAAVGTDNSSSTPKGNNLMIFDMIHNSWVTSSHAGSINSAGSYGTVTNEVVHTWTPDDNSANGRLKPLEIQLANKDLLLAELKIEFDTGTIQIHPGDFITEENSTPYATVIDVVLVSGTWTGGDAAGYLYVEDIKNSGTWSNNEKIYVNDPESPGAGGVQHALVASGGETFTPVLTQTYSAGTTYTFENEEEKRLIEISDFKNNSHDLIDTSVLKSMSRYRKMLFTTNPIDFHATLDTTGKFNMIPGYSANYDAGQTNDLKITYDSLTAGQTYTDNRLLDTLKSNPIVDWEGNLVWHNGTTDISKWSDTPQATPHMFIKTPFVDFESPSIPKRISKVYVTHRNAGTNQIGLYGEIVSKPATGNQGAGEISNDFFIGYLAPDSSVGNMVTQEFDMPTQTLSGNAEANISFSKVYSIRLYIFSYKVWSYGDGHSLTGTAPAGFEINDISIVYRMGKSK